MKAIHYLAAASLLVPLWLSSQTVKWEDEVTSGYLSGTRLRVVESKAWDRGLANPTKATTITLPTTGPGRAVHVQMTLVHHNCVRERDSKELPIDCFQFQLLGEKTNSFEWSCWVPAFRVPHHFEVVTVESGESLVSFVGSEVQFFRLSQPRKDSDIRRLFWQDGANCGQHPDALPSLPMRQLQDALGWRNMTDWGATEMSVVVESVSDKTGELQVRVRGAAPKPQCMFALRDGKWELVKSDK